MKTTCPIPAPICVVFLAFSLASAGAQTTPPSLRIDGTWRWTLTMPDGTVARPKLVLETEDGQLGGSSSFRAGSEMPITNAVLTGNQLRFQVIRQRYGREIVSTYSGTWSGKTIHGKIESNWAGEPQSYDWVAERAHEGAEGIWQWTTVVRGRNSTARLKLEQDGEALTGWFPGLGRGGRRLPIKNGSIKDGELYFEVELVAGPSRVLTIYRGKQAGDTIKGTIETPVGQQSRKTEWLAKRTD